MVKRLTRPMQREQVRRRLLKAAARLLSRRGYHGASVDAIAEEAGYTSGALYSHFGSKDGLFLALLEESLARRLRGYEEAFAGPGDLRERAARAADASTRSLREDPAAFLLFIEFWAVAVRDRRLRRRFAKRWEAIHDAIARWVEEGAEGLGLILEPGDARRAAVVINALGNGIALAKLANPDEVPDELFAWGLGLLSDSFLSRVGGDKRMEVSS
jgi:AcrR family transcriptional regulator